MLIVESRWWVYRSLHGKILSLFMFEKTNGEFYNEWIRLTTPEITAQSSYWKNNQTLRGGSRYKYTSLLFIIFQKNKIKVKAEFDLKCQDLIAIFRK